MSHLTINDIKSALRNRIPEPIGGWSYYSVMLPLVEKDGELHILYELRSKTLKVQPGEVSFPGGFIEKGETAEQAAIRETAEELGLPQSAVETISELNYLITPGNRTLYCFLGKIDADALDKAEINCHEVEDYFLVPLNWLMENEPKIYVNRIITEQAVDLPMDKLAPEGKYNWRSGKSSVPVYVWPDSKKNTKRYIWGMTARLTMSFIETIK